MMRDCWQVAPCRYLWVLALLLLTADTAEVSAQILKTVQMFPVLVDPKVTCALSITRSQLADSTHITVLGQASWLGGFLQGTVIPFTLLQLGDDADGRVVVWWQSGNAQAAVDAARVVGMVRLVVVSGSSGEQRVFRYREDCDNGNRVSRAVLAGECGQTGVLQAQDNLFPDLSHWDFQGCPLHLTTKFAERRSEGGYSITETLSVVPFAFAKQTNASLEVTLFDATHRGVRRAFQGVDRTRPDVILGFFYQHIFNELFDVVPSFYKDSVIFAVPSGLGAEPSAMALLHSEFTPVVWVLLGLAYLLLLAVLAVWWWSTREHPVQDAGLFALSTLLGTSHVVPITGTRARALVTFWLMICIVISAAYQAMLHGLETAPPRPAEINSLVQLAESGLPVLGYSKSYSAINDIVKERGDATLMTLLARYQNTTDMKAAVRRVALDRDAAIFYVLQRLLALKGHWEAAAGRQLIHVLPELWTGSKQLSLFLLHRGSPLTPSITLLTTRALDAGLLRNLWPVESLERHIKTQMKPLGLDGLRAVFVLLIMGLAVSALVLLIEMLPHRSRGKQLLI